MNKEKIKPSPIYVIKENGFFVHASCIGVHYLDNVVKDFKQKEHQMVISGRREKKPRRTKCLQQMQQLCAGHHGQCF